QAIALTGMAKSCSLSETYSFLASACLGQGKLQEALSAAQEAVTIGQQSEILLDLAGAWRVMGQVAAALRQSGEHNGGFRSPAVLREPSDCFAESARLYDTIGAHDEKARTMRIWAEFDRQQATQEHPSRWIGHGDLPDDSVGFIE